MNKISKSDFDSIVEFFETLAQWKREFDLQVENKSDEVESASMSYRCHTTNENQPI